MLEKTILVIDDMLFDREILAKNLKSKIGCKIIECGNGEDVFELLKTTSVDLVLLDIVMPIMSGLDVVRQIRLTFSAAELPIIMVSGKSEDAMVIDCIKAGANDYIVKPLKFEVALTRIQNHLLLSESIKEKMKFQEMQTINNIVATYSHEINNPLAIAIGYISAMKLENNNNESFSKLENALWRISDIVKKIKEVTGQDEIPYEEYTGDVKLVKLK